MPTFLGIPWGASREAARRTLEERPGVTPAPELSDEDNLVFHGGILVEEPVAMWTLQFVRDQLHTAKVLFAPEPEQVLPVFEALSAYLAREHGPPAQGGVLVGPSYGRDRLLEAIAAGQGMAAHLHVFGRDGTIEGSILCQILPEGAVVLTYQDQRLNLLALSARGALDPGLLSSPGSGGNRTGSGCFVASVAVPDPHHAARYVLRRYRDEVLSRTLGGRAIIRLYEVLGPGLAYQVSRRPRLRTLAVRLVAGPAFRYALGSLRAARQPDRRAYPEGSRI